MDQGLSGVHAQAESDLMQAAATPLQERQGGVDSFVGDQAAIDAEEAVTAALDESYFAPGLRGEADVVSVSPRVVSTEGWRDGRVRKATDAAKLFAYYVSLQFQLVGVIDMLPLAASAGAEVLAGCLDAVRGRVEHLHNAAHQYAGPRLIYFDDGFLSGYAVVREDHPGRGVRFSGDAGKGAAFERHILEDNGQPIWRALGWPPSFAGHIRLQVYVSDRRASQNGDLCVISGETAKGIAVI
jgi:hypothetical protein